QWANDRGIRERPRGGTDKYLLHARDGGRGDGPAFTPRLPARFEARVHGGSQFGTASELGARKDLGVASKVALRPAIEWMLMAAGAMHAQPHECGRCKFGQ